MCDLVLVAEVKTCHKLLEVVSGLVLLKRSRIGYEVKELSTECKFHDNVGHLNLLATRFPVHVNADLFLFYDVPVL